MSSSALSSTEGQSTTAPANPRRLKGHSAAATCCIASLTRPGVIATSGEDGRVCLFDLRCKDVALSVKAGENAVSSICFRPGNEDIMYFSIAAEVAGYDIRKGPSWNRLESYAYNKEEINQISVSPKSSYLAAADDSGDVKIIDVHQQCLYKTLRAVHTSICSSVQFLSWKPWSVITGGLDSRLAMWDFSKGRSYNIINYGATGSSSSCSNPAQSFNPAFVHSVAVPEEELSFGISKICAVARGDGIVDVMDIESELSTAQSRNSSKSRKASGSRSRASSSTNGCGDEAVNRNIRRFHLDHTLGGHSAAVSCVSFSLFGERGKFLVSGGNDAFIKIWDWSKLLDVGQEIVNSDICWSINARKKVNWLCTTPTDRENLVVCDTSKVVKVYDIA